MGHRRKADRCEGGIRWRSRITLPPLATGTVTAKRRFRDCKNPGWYERIASAPDGNSFVLNHL
jgi:hypothetical protein